jgi:hypothetical protein
MSNEQKVLVFKATSIFGALFAVSLLQPSSSSFSMRRAALG